jgi:hypothetical protein
MSATRKILMPVKKPEELKSPRNALQEAIDRALRPTKTELQLKADEYYEKALASTYGVKRYEHLEDGLIMFTYSDFSITKIRQLYSEKYGTYFVSQLYQTTRCKNDPETRGRTVADELNEKWAEVIPITQSSNESVLNRLKEMAKSTYPTTVSI